MQELNVFELGLVHSKIVPQFVEHGLPDLATNFGFVGADRLDILLVEDDAVRPRAEVEHTPPSGGHTVEFSQKQSAGLVGTSFLCRRTPFFAQLWPVFNQYGQVVNLFAKLYRKRIQDFRYEPNEVFASQRDLLFNGFASSSSTVIRNTDQGPHDVCGRSGTLGGP